MTDTTNKTDNVFLSFFFFFSVFIFDLNSVIRCWNTVLVLFEENTTIEQEKVILKYGFSSENNAYYVFLAKKILFLAQSVSMVWYFPSDKQRSLFK